MCFGGPKPQPLPRQVQQQDLAQQAADAAVRRRRNARGVGANILAGNATDLTPAPLGARILLGR